MKEKKVYESPQTVRTLVVLESGFLKASVVDDKKEGITVEATPQDYEEVTVENNSDFTWE
ncbi:MAG: hypothetical protein ACI4UA_03335 [Bacteroidaceae bacterium]